MATKTTHMTFKVTVQYDYHDAARGPRDGIGGPPLEPDEPAYVEVDTTAYITTPAGYKLSFSLTPEQIPRLENEIMGELTEPVKGLTRASKGIHT